MKKKNLFWAAFFIVAASCVILGQLNLLGNVGFWTILVTVFLAGCFISSISNKSIPGVIFTLAFLLIVWGDALGLHNISAWAILVAAALLSIGITMIYHPTVHKYWDEKGEFNGDETVENVNGETFNISTSFGSGIKYVNSDNFKYAHLDCSFGAMKVYFDNATVNEGATVDVNISFGGVELYVPRDWRVVTLAETSFAGVDEKNRSSGVGNATLTITGKIKFSGITIIYI